MKNHISLYEIVNNFVLKLISRTNRELGVPQKTYGLVLCYHSIGNEKWRFNTTPKEFEKQLLYLTKHFQVVPLSDLFKGGCKTNQIAITFDDGYYNVLKYAAPILNKYNLKASVFVIGDKKNVNRDQLDNAIDIMDIKDIKKLKKLGWEIGFHTKTHGDMSVLKPREIQQEIMYGKIYLEKKLGFKLKYFAYPRGYYSDRIMSIVKKSNFQKAFTVDPKYISKSSDMLVGRVSIEGGVTISQFSALLSPLGIRVSFYMMQLLKLKELAKSMLHAQIQ